MELLAQIVGFSAVATFLWSYQQKKRQNIILLNTVSRGLYILQYLLLGAFAGAILDVLGAISSAIAGKKDNPFIKKHTKAVFIGINLCVVLAGVIIAAINQNWLDLLPIAGVLLHTSAFWLNDEKVIRRVSLLGSPFWFVYNFLSRAYGSAIGDVLTICSILVAMVRHKNADAEREGNHVW